MMRIITPEGALLNVTKIVPYCEMRFQFNAEARRMVEIARGTDSEPTGLEIRFESSPAQMTDFVDGLFIGNLKPEQVKEIKERLLRDGCFDFSKMDYQKPRCSNEAVFDNGETKPYTEKLYRGFNPSMISTVSASNPAFTQGIGGIFNPIKSGGVYNAELPEDDDEEVLDEQE